MDSLGPSSVSLPGIKGEQESLRYAPASLEVACKHLLAQVFLYAL